MNQTAAGPSPTSPGWRGALAGAVVILAVCAAWWNSLSAPFLFDDQSAILRNPPIRSCATALSPPAGAAGATGRPLVNFSLALNYALGGADVRGYHLFNLGVHALNALLVLALARRVMLHLRRPPAEAMRLAFALAPLWAVHPLQTESVTFVTQRTELLGALFLLLTLSAFARSAVCHLLGDKPGERLWSVAAVLACLLGMAAKEIVAAAPLLVLLWDRTFISGGFAAAWRARRGLYLSLASTWLLLLALVLRTPERGGIVGFGLGVGAWEYLLTQCRALVLYLKLSVWPHPLVLDYGDAVVSGPGEVWWQGCIVLLLLAATGWALIRRPVLGFLGAWFFLLLAPSTSLVPLTTQTIAEHRMYLPLLAVLALPVAVLARLPRAPASLAVAVLALGAGALTVARNHDYRSAIALWADTAAKAPGNYRAHYNLGNALAAAGRDGEALRSYEAALRLKPENGSIRYNYAGLLTRVGRNAEAIREYEAALRLGPEKADAHVNLGALLAGEGRIADALAHFRRAAELEPGAADIRLSLAQLLQLTGDRTGAERELHEARRLQTARPATARP